LRRPYRFRQATAVGVYSGLLRDAVLRVKRSHQEPLTLALGRLLADQLRARPDWVDPDLVLPVPMHWTRRLLRGVNGPELLAEAVASELSLPSVTRLLSCRRRTKKQGTLLPAARRRNVRGAYGVARRGRLAAKHVLLVDDVLTTGATLDELTRVLQRAGAESVSAAVLARGIGYD